MKKAWAILQIILLLSLGLTKVHAANDGQGNRYFKENIGIKVIPGTTLNAELTVNGNIMMVDGTQGLFKILKTDANGLASWEDVGYFPPLDGSNDSYNNLVIDNGYFQDLTLNGITTVDEDGVLNFIGQPNGYILTMYANGFAHWAPNYGANGESSDPLWKEEFNTLLPKTNNGEHNLALGDNTTAGANTFFTKNGAAQFNQFQTITEDINLGTDHTYFGLKVEADEDQVGIKLGSPDTRLDVLGMFALRSNGSDFTASADPFSSVYWTAKNSAFGNNGDVLAKINNSAQEKVFKLVDFEGSESGSNGGIATENGLVLENLTPERLVRTDSDKRLVSEPDLISNGTFSGIAVANPEAELEVGDAMLDFVDGVDDVSVRGSIEADGTIYATNFVGDSTGLQFNGVDLYNSLIYTSGIFGVLDFNGGAFVKLNGEPWFLDANLEFSGNKTFKTGNKFELMGAPSGNPEVAFHVSNGRVGIMTTSPQALLDVNGQIMYRDGNQANGRLLVSTDNNGSAQWQDIDFDTVQYATNVDNATTANIADNMVNGSIVNSTFLGGTINGSTLYNVDFSSTPYASEWVDGPDGLYPIDGPAEDVMVGGSTLAGSPITMEANGTFTATKFVGDFSDVSNIPYTQEWNDQGSFMHPFDLAGDESMIIGGGTIPTADTIFNPDGSVVINEQAQNVDFRIEGQAEDHLFNTNSFNDTVGINRVGVGADLTVNGAISYRLDAVAVTAGTGITLADHQSTRVLLLESSGACNVDLTASPQIAAGQDGQVITLMGRYSDEIITIDDGDGVALNNNVSIDLRAKDSITLMYSASLGEWLEISRVDYIERPSDSLNRGTCI